ncbi:MULTISPECIES: hypothetical protein [unclassified Streptomyces]|uniref:hypothetical protein n=1 Tax=unclassified Streptomyces TaxID=2593676 RepID=UPI0033B87B8B|nr:hypothetical protein OG199_04535 [Streptomyces sp. NBC_01176]
MPTPSPAVRVMALAIAALSALVVALVAFIVLPHLGANILTATLSSCGAFVTVSAGTLHVLREFNLF